MRPLNEIIVHCTATRPNWWANRTTTEKVAEVRRWHVEERGWADIGYHYLIDRDGTVAEGRSVYRVGAHVKGHNTGTIGVSLFGGHGGAADDQFSDHFTPEQDAALRRLLTDLCERWPTIDKISGHSDYAAKACPCFSVQQWLNDTPSRPPARPAEARPPRSSPPLSRRGGTLLSLFNRIFKR